MPRQRGKDKVVGFYKDEFKRTKPITISSGARYPSSHSHREVEISRPLATYNIEKQSATVAAVIESMKIPNKDRRFLADTFIEYFRKRDEDFDEIVFLQECGFESFEEYEASV